MARSIIGVASYQRSAETLKREKRPTPAGVRPSAVARMGLGADLSAKRLEIFREIVPSLRRVLVTYDPREPDDLDALKIARVATSRIELELIENPITEPLQIEAALADLEERGRDGILIVQSGLSLNIPGAAWRWRPRTAFPPCTRTHFGPDSARWPPSGPTNPPIAPRELPQRLLFEPLVRNELALELFDATGLLREMPPDQGNDALLVRDCVVELFTAIRLLRELPFDQGNHRLLLGNQLCQMLDMR
jgi:hypothetical protein